MFYRGASGIVIGVLNDYDLSSIRNVPSGQERTGTVPFMAMALLTDKGIAGQVEHLYRYDAESFIWVLTWVCLRYEDGKLLSQGRPLDSWLAVGANRCLEKKSSFLTALGDNNSHPSASHQENWEIVLKCWEVIYYIHYGPTRKYRNTSDREIFRLWLQVHVKGHLPDDLMFGE
jgi:hypothetical protein